MSDVMLSVQDLSASYGAAQILYGLGFEVGQGEVVALMGRNGAGKTTTIRMILGIFFPDGGEIRLFGAPWTADALDRVGYLPEERGMYRKMKLLEHLRFFCALKGAKGPAVEKRLEEFLKRFDLWNRRDENIEALSKGNQQKAQLTGVLAFDPELIILDEPMSGLDPVNVILVRELLLELRAAGKTILLSTHQMAEAEKLCDTVTLIHQGRVMLAGDLAKVRQEFGARKVNLEFEGDGAFLETLPEVAHAEVNHQRATLTLRDGESPHTLLKTAVARLNINRFDCGDASLEEIFVKTVGPELASGAAEVSRAN